MSILINSFAITIIFFIIWWFWLSKTKISKAIHSNEFDITVDNGVYVPSVIEAETGKPLILRLFRNDPNPCAEKIIFNELNVNKDLPLHVETTLKLDVEQPGEYEFTCQMGMYRGRLIVK